MTTGIASAETRRRPRMLYFAGPWDYLGERIRHSYIAPFDELIAQDFEVVPIVGNADFRKEVERHRPDLVLFHTGCEAPSEPEVSIENVDAYPEIPRLGWIFRDPFSPSRMMTMNRLRRWGVHHVFTDFRPSDSPLPYFEESFYVPWWVDDGVFHDYGEDKAIPVSLTGSGWWGKCIYTWRQDIAVRLLPRFPVFHAPSLGNRQSGNDYVGEAYARLLNRSLFSAGCGTVSRCLTRKLIEIPAAKCCLITEETEILKAAGFRDGENCIFATPDNVVGKVERLLAAPDELARVTQAGYDLVHSRHTQRHRRIFGEWFNLWKTKRPNQRIVQVNPFGPLQLWDEGAPRPAVQCPAENPLVDKLRAGYANLHERQWEEALAAFNWVINIIPCVAEARIGAAISLIRLGRPTEASPHLGYNLNLLTKHFGYVHSDPIDMSVTAMLCFRMNDVASGLGLLRSYPTLRHPALNAARFIARRTAKVNGADDPLCVSDSDSECNVETVHMLPQRTFADWTAFLEKLVKA